MLLKCLFTLVIDHHAEQKRHDILPGGPSREKVRQHESALPVGSAKGLCLCLRQLRPPIRGVGHLGNHVGIFNGRGKLPNF